jgi:hypothetical protein
MMHRALRFALVLTLASAAYAGVARGACTGDCNDNGAVSINELVLGVNIALGSSALSACPAFDADGLGTVSVSELVAAVNNALRACPATRTPASTSTATAMAENTATVTAQSSPTASITVAAPTNSATVTATATSVPATNTATAVATATAPATDTATAVATVTAQPPTQTATVTAAPSNTAAATATGIATATDTGTPTVTAAAPTSTVTNTVGAEQTPTATSTQSTTPTPTATSTPEMAAVCDNGFLEAGETCESCAADCTIKACTATTPLQTFKIDFQAPIGSLPSVVSALVGYRSDHVSLPNTGTGSRVKMRPTGTSQLVNDLNYALRVLINAQAGGSVPSGKLFTVDFDYCQGQPAVTPADFGCQVESCGSSAGPIEGCRVVVLP